MKKLVIASLIALSLVGCGQVESVTNSDKSATGLLERTMTLMVK